MKESIEIHHLTVNYEKISALRDIDLRIPKGSLVGIIGPNGAGKSTLLQSLVGSIKPFSGTILFSGKPFSKMRQKIAYVPQKRAIDWEFPITVLDVVLMGRYPKLKGFKWYRKEDKKAAKAILERLEMGSLENRQISALSGGQQQRLFIARALLQEADFFFLDEPFSAVDQATEAVIIGILKELRDQEKTILVVHHDLKTAAQYFDQAILINTSLVFWGKTKDALSSANISRAYGQKRELFNEATSLSSKEKAGLLP